MGFIHGQNSQHQRPIGNQDGLSRLDTRGQTGIATGQFRGVASVVIITRQRNGLALDEVNLIGIVGKETGTDFGTFGVQQNCCVEKESNIRIST